MGVEIANILSDGELHPPSKELNALIEEAARLMGYDVYFGTPHFMKLLAKRGFLRPHGRKEVFVLEVIGKDYILEFRPEYSFINHDYIDYVEEKDEENHFFLGCDWNSGNVWLRCAVNPMGPCKGCELYEPRELEKPVYRLTREETTSFIHKAKGRLSYLLMNKWVHLSVYIAAVIVALVLQMWAYTRNK